MTRSAWILFLLLMAGAAHAQENKGKFEPLEPGEEGPLVDVTCMLQDHQGFMWFGTFKGLHRFDGYEYQTFVYKPDDSTSISGNYINTLFEDRNQRLWVGTDSGLNYFDPHTSAFYAFRHDPEIAQSLSHDAIYSLAEDADGNLWVGTERGVNRFRMETDGEALPTAYQNQHVSVFDSLQVNFIFSNKQNRLWFGTHTGLFVLDASGEGKQVQGNGATASLNKGINVIYETPEGRLLLGTEEGLLFFDPASGRVESLQNPSGSPEGDIRSIVEDKNDYVWAGIRSGKLLRIDLRDWAVFPQELATGGNTNNVLGATLLSLYVDGSGVLWTSMYGQGVYKLDLFKINFKTIRPFKQPGSSRQEGEVYAIGEDHTGKMWFGGDNGLKLIDMQSEERMYLGKEPEDSTSLSDDVIYCMLKDSRNDMWVGTARGGLNRVAAASIESGNYTFQHFRYEQSGAQTLASDQVLTLLEDRNGYIWIGTEEGLNSFDPASQRTLTYLHVESNPASLSDNIIQALYQDRKGVLWIGTANGLNSLVPNLDEGTGFTRYFHIESDSNSLANNSVLAIAEDADGYLWVGTDGGGLSSLSPDRSTFHTYTNDQGLPDNVIYGILQDRDENLWISTNEGICRMKRQGDTETFSYVNYNSKNWLPCDLFSLGAYFKSSRGLMYFGCDEGIVSFHPDHIRESDYPPPVVITRVEIEDEDQWIDVTDRIEQGRLTLRYMQNNLRIQFAALSFAEVEKNQYRYRMEGYVNSFKYLQNDRMDDFRKLNPGTYEFVVQAANNHGIWNNEGASLQIVIRRPFYQTIGFYILCGLLALLLMFGYGQFRIRNLEKNRKILEARVEERTREVQRQKEELEVILKDLQETQSQLVESEKMASLGLLTAGVAHEINNPINFVSANVEPLKRDIADILEILNAYEDRIKERQLDGDFSDVSKMKKNLDYDFLVEEIDSLLSGIEEGARRTSEIVKGLRNFTRLDEDELKLANVNEGIESTLLILSSEFRDRIEVVKNLGAIPEIPCYPGKLNQVYMNIINNAVQAIDGKGKIFISTSCDNGYIKVAIKDTGKGMEEEVRQRIFDPFFTTKEVGHGTGLGLSISFGIIENHKGKIVVNSKPGEGTEFEILLPMTQN